MVISIVVANFDAKKIIIDNDNLTDILVYDAFKRKKLPPNMLKSVQSPLCGFNGEVVIPEGIITLTMTLGIAPHHFNLMINLMLVKVPPAYNMILGKHS